MDNSFVLRKRVFAAVTTAAMILGSLSAAIVPQTATAATGGDVIKGESLSTVYYYGYDGSRYTFPNSNTYMTWYSDFDDVETISDSELADISLGGNVVYRPGSYWIKITSDAKTYAVSTDGTIHWIESEDVATDLAGSDWNTMIHDVPDVFFVDYSSGASLASATAFDGMAYMDGGDYYLSWGGEKRMIDADGRDANRYWDWMFLDGEGIDDSSLTDGDDITSEICELTDVAQTGDCEDDVVLEGDLDVSVASDTPASISVPNSAAGVEVVTFDFEADDATELNALTVTLEGLTTTSAIGSNGVYLYEGDSRLTEGRSINSSTRQATFSGLNLEFAAGETRSLSVVVDMGAADASPEITNGSFYFTIEEADDVDADGDVGGSFPLEGETMSITDIDVGSVTIVKTGSIANPTVGDSDAVIGKFQVQAGSGEDITFNAVTLKIDDAADHSNFKLWQGSEQVGTGEYIGNKLVLFTLDDGFAIEKSENVNFSVSADIGGESGDVIKVYLDNDADFKASGDDYGFNVSVYRLGTDDESGSYVDADNTDGYDGSTCDGSATDECSRSTIQGGDVTFAFNGPSAGDVKAGAEDYTFLEFSATSVAWAEVDSMEVDIAATEAEGSDSGLDDGVMTDIKLVMADDGSLVAGPEELSSSGSATAQSVTFSENWVLEAGETYDMAITADVEDGAEENDTFTFTIDMSQFSIEDANNDAIASSSIVPSSDIAGYTHTVRTASLTVTLASTPATGDHDYVRGSNDVDVVAFNFAAGDGSDIEVTDVTVTTYVREDSVADTGGFTAGADDDDSSTSDDSDSGSANVDISATDRISSCSLYDSSDNLVAGPESVSSSSTGEILFENFSWMLSAGATEKVYVRCNLANVSPGSNADEFGFDIDAASDITALDDEGSTLDSSTEITATTVNDSDNDFAAGTYISVKANGSMSVAVDSSTPSADFLLTGSSDNHVSTIQFSATDEDFEITTVTFSEEAAEDATGTSDSSAYANNIALVTIEYPMEDGTTGTATTSVSSNEAEFNLASGSGIYVASGESADVDVYVDVPASDRNTGGSATSNERVLMDLFVDTTNDDNFEAIGQGSGVTLDDDDVSSGTSTDPNTFVVREAAPTVTLHSSSPSGGKIPGDQEVFRFTVAASSNEDIVLNELIWALSSTDNASSDWNFCDQAGVGTGELAESDFDFYNLDDEGTSTALDAADSEWTLLTTDGTECTDSTDETAFIQLELATAEVVPAGSSYTYALYMDTTGASSSNDDSIQLTLEDDPIVSTYLTGSTLANNITRTATSFDVASGEGSNFTAGDIIEINASEKALVTDVSTDTLTVIRGYLGSTTAAATSGDNVKRMPSAFVWEDDGDSSTSATGEDWGAYLVDELPLTGGAIQF